jgi:hypothetical protein
VVFGCLVFTVVFAVFAVEVDVTPAVVSEEEDGSDFVSGSSSDSS